MIKLFRNFNKKDYLIFLISFLIISTQIWLELKMPEYTSKIAVLIQSNGTKISEILNNGCLMLLCALFGIICSITVGYLLAFLASRFSMNVRSLLFKKVEDLSMSEIKQFKTDSLITRTTNDITQVEMFIGMGLQLLIKAPITAIWAITKIMNKSWQWSVATAISVAVLLTVIIILVIIVLPKFKIVQKMIDNVNEVTRENINGIRVIRAFNAEKYQENKFDKVNNDLTNVQLFSQKTLAILSPAIYLVMNTIGLVIFFIGAILINDALFIDKLSLFGDMIVFSSYASQIIMSFLMLALIFMILPRAQVSATRINEVLDIDIAVKDGNITTSNNNGTIEFKNVSFKYPDAKEYILKDISFKANSGETIAFIGSTGSGKSTLVNLVVRFYDATDGEILVDGINIKDYKLQSLYNKIGYVPQKAMLFDNTIYNNIAYGNNGKKKDKKIIEKALDIAQAKEFVEKMDKGIDSHISEGATNVSGGQKQRLAIARAIARDPEIYIFDDSFSALDYKTDALLRKELKKYTKNATNLIVSSRIGTIMNADKIIVLDNGKCVGMGTHKELLNNCDVYKEIALSQLSKEELENGR